MATFTSIPQTTSSQFRHYDPTSLKQSEGDLPAVPRQPPQVQKTGHIEDVEDMDSGMCDLFGAGHGKSIHEFASGDGHHQLRLELRDEGEKDHATTDLALEELFDRSSRDFHPIGESGATEEHRSATNFQRSNGASDYSDKSHHPTTTNEGDHAKQRGDLAAAVGNAFSVEGIEGPYHKGSLAEDETFSGIASVINGPSTTPKRSHQSLAIDTTTTIQEVLPNVISDLEPENSHPAKRRRMAERQAQSPILEPTYTPKSTVMLDLSDQASRPSTSDGPIPGSQAAGRKDDGTISLALSPTDLRDVEDGDGAYVQGAVEEVLQARGYIPPSEGLEFEQDVGRESNRRVMNKQGSGSKVGEILEEELSHSEACNTSPSRFQRRGRRVWAPETRRELSNTAPRPLDCNTVPTRAPQQTSAIAET
ncbi:hypothetical protein TW65_06675 [Stemphylium lycopersici]|nr:hypothetical protein TW65_06675 [Stemphylium lycopersici]